MTDTDSNLERQQQELEALKATFPEPGAISIDALPVDANLQYSKINSRSLPSQINLVPISGKVFLQNAKLNNEPIGFSFQLPEAYPEVAPSIHVLCDTGKNIHNQLSEAVNDVIAQNKGSELLLLIIQALEDAYEQLDKDALDITMELQEGRPSKYGQDTQKSLGRKAIWFHHIKNLNKRKNILNWARELNLRGFSKPGFPGIIICEGVSEDIEEYFARIKVLKWQAVSVRAEEVDAAKFSINQLKLAPWHFEENFQELEEGDMDKLGSKCKETGLEHLFRAALKLPT